MLTVYSAHGSPGASTTAMYLAAQWASTGIEVLLIEADSGGGSLSHHLGIQFTPGSASFVAAGLTVSGGNLIDHSQDVLFNNLHVMPSTSSPTGAREIVRWWDERAGELRAISETEMAVIVDAGRITADSVAADLTAHAAGAVVVARGDRSPTGLEHIAAMLSAEACGAGVERFVVTVGDSPLSAEEWREKCDITLAGSIQDFAEVTGDLTAFLNRNKRKSKKWRVSLEEVAEKLLPYAKSPASGSLRSRRPAAAAEKPPAKEEPAPPPRAAAEEPAPAAPAAEEPYEDGAALAVHDEAPVAGTYAEVPPQPGPYYGAPAEAYGQAPPPPDDPYYQTATPYAAAPPSPAHQQYVPEGQPAYFEPPPAPPEHVFYDTPLPVYQPPPAAHEPPQPQQSGYQMPPELLAVYQQQEVAPPWAPPPQEQSPYPQQAYQPHPELPPPYHQQPPPGPGPAQQPPQEAPPAYQQQASNRPRRLHRRTSSRRSNRPRRLHRRTSSRRSNRPRLHRRTSSRRSNRPTSRREPRSPRTSRSPPPGIARVGARRVPAATSAATAGVPSARAAPAGSAPFPARAARCSAARTDPPCRDAAPAARHRSVRIVPRLGDATARAGPARHIHQRSRRCVVTEPAPS